MKAVNGKNINRAMGKLEIELNGEYKLINLLVSAAPMKYNDQNMAIIMIEDISELVELKGLLPICASCKRVRKEDGLWSKIEQYIENHSELEFTHGLCPECMEKLYPEYYEQIKKRDI